MLGLHRFRIINMLLIVEGCFVDTDEAVSRAVGDR